MTNPRHPRPSLLTRCCKKCSAGQFRSQSSLDSVSRRPAADAPAVRCTRAHSMRTRWERFMEGCSAFGRPAWGRLRHDPAPDNRSPGTRSIDFFRLFGNAAALGRARRHRANLATSNARGRPGRKHVAKARPFLSSAASRQWHDYRCAVTSFSLLASRSCPFGVLGTLQLPSFARPSLLHFESRTEIAKPAERQNLNRTEKGNQEA